MLRAVRHVQRAQLPLGIQIIPQRRSEDFREQSFQLGGVTELDGAGGGYLSAGLAGCFPD